VGSFLQSLADGVYLSVKLQPRASKNQIDGPLGDELKIKVTAAPVDAEANQALVDLLAEKLDSPRGAVRLPATRPCASPASMPKRFCAASCILDHPRDLNPP
jgi:uncharacterized protein YggU (UPF0235/DUF167 family)